MEEDIYSPRVTFKARRIDWEGILTLSNLFLGKLINGHCGIGPGNPCTETEWGSAPSFADTGDTDRLAGQSREPRTLYNIDMCPASLPEHNKISRTPASENKLGPGTADAVSGTVLLQGNTQIPSICVHHHSGAGVGESQLRQDASSSTWCLGVPQYNRMAVTTPLNDVRFLTVPWSRPHHCDERPKVDDTRKRRKLLRLHRGYTEAYQALVSRGLRQMKKTCNQRDVSTTSTSDRTIRDIVQPVGIAGLSPHI